MEWGHPDQNGSLKRALWLLGCEETRGVRQDLPDKLGSHFCGSEERWQAGSGGAEMKMAELEAVQELIKPTGTQNLPLKWPRILSAFSFLPLENLLEDHAKEKGMYRMRGSEQV